MAQSEKVAIERLASSVNKMLEQYRTDIEGSLDTITKKMGQKGAAALRAASKRTFKTHNKKNPYAKGWTYKSTSNRKSKGAVIYNKKSGLPHLLENEHVIRNGTMRIFGTYLGKKHIDPVAKTLLKAYEEEVVKTL